MEARAPSAQWYKGAYAKPQNDQTFANLTLNPNKHATPYSPSANRLAFTTHLPQAARVLPGRCSLQRQLLGLDVNESFPSHNSRQPRASLRSSDAVTEAAAAASTSAGHERSSKHASLQDTGDNGHSSGDGEKVYDVVTLGNLCVDVLVEVTELPPADREGKWEYLQRVRANPPGEEAWEAGGNLNFAIAASRLGLECSSFGHVARDPFGRFLGRVLSEEGVQLMRLEEEGAEEEEGRGESAPGNNNGSAPLYCGETLACWVFLDPSGRHAFASRFDFNREPAFSHVTSLPTHAAHLITSSSSLFINGFAFDEFPPTIIKAAAQAATAAGGRVFFDPGPRTKSLMMGGDGRNTAEVFAWLVDNCHVLLLTSEEAEAITGRSDSVLSARVLLHRGSGAKQWVAVKRGAQGCVLATATEGLFTLPGFKVDVADTVGCGDSFASAIVLGMLRKARPATALALANAVGAATAMGTGAGRNVARATQVAEILLGLQAREEGWHDDYEDWDADVWLEDQGKRFRVGHVEVHGAAECPSGISLLESVRMAASLLHTSLAAVKQN